MTYDIRKSWIVKGELMHVLPDNLAGNFSEMDLLARKGAVRLIETSDGLMIDWVMLAPNWASLYYLAEHIHLYDGPFIFNYFLSGWFTEKIATVTEAKDRISQLMTKSDVHIGRHTFVKEIEPAKTTIPHVLRDALTDMTAIPELSVDCMFDKETGKFLVHRVGAQSSLAKVYGMSPVSTPCLTGNTYDEVISRAYKNVLDEEKPHYDHVLAAMSLPDQTVIWAPYQRVILPHRFPNGNKGVTVVTERTEVDIKVV
jgi:hypothetical protein